MSQTFSADATKAVIATIGLRCVVGDQAGGKDVWAGWNLDY
jgi:hypothetical protein